MIEKRGFTKDEIVWYLECESFGFSELEYGKKPVNCIEKANATPLIEGAQYRIHVGNYLMRAITHDTSDNYDFTVE